MIKGKEQINERNVREKHNTKTESAFTKSFTETLLNSSKNVRLLRNRLPVATPPIM